MADATRIDKFPKATNKEDDVEALAKENLKDGAKSSVVSEDADNWILTTVWPGDC